MKITKSDSQQRAFFEHFDLPEFEFAGNQNLSLAQSRQAALDFYQTEECENLWSSVNYAKWVAVMSVIFVQLFLYLAREVSGLPIDLAVRLFIYKSFGLISLFFLITFAIACAAGIYYLIQMMVLHLRDGGYFENQVHKEI